MAAEWMTTTPCECCGAQFLVRARLTVARYDDFGRVVNPQELEEQMVMLGELLLLEDAHGTA